MKINDSEYTTIHAWIRKHHSRPKYCQKCGCKPNILHWANITGKYVKDIKHYISLCPSCHAKLDKGIKDGYCINNHAMTPKNSYIKPAKNSQPECRICRETSRQKYKRRFCR